MGRAKKVRGREILFKLALNLGRTVSELENSMTHSEYLEWQEYYKTEPFHADRQETQTAVMSFLISTANGGKNKIDDFLLSHRDKSNSTSKAKPKVALADKVKHIFGGMS